MIARLRIMAVPVLAAVVALFVGLGATLLRTGRVQPLDWLAPGFVAIAVMVLAASRHGKRPGWIRMALYLALALLPALLLCALAATIMPWQRMAVLAVLLSIATACLGCMMSRRRSVWIAAAVWLLMLAGVNWVVYRLEQPIKIGLTPDVGVMSALPLFSDGSDGAQDLLDVGNRSPVLRGVYFIPEPVDILNGKSLAPFTHLLLAHPRLLRPEELVALDNWVRAGGHVVILADPLLRWPTEHPLGDPRRAPLTSLLDPLLTHWGLTLEPADAGHIEERRVLANGSVLQLAGASRFTPAKGAPCKLEERGLIARCAIGAGKAVLVADADWINDLYWTIDPDRPRDRQLWTSDAPRVLTALVRGGAPFDPLWPWLKSQEVLISALRWSLALILMLGILLAFKGPVPISTHHPPRPKRGSEGDSDSASPDSVT